MFSNINLFIVYYYYVCCRAGVLLDDRYWVITSDKLLPNPFRTYQPHIRPNFKSLFIDLEDYFTSGEVSNPINWFL